MASRSVVVHGHFYQPPREDPWLGLVEAERSAAPYHDWNRRIEQECYRAVTAARIPDASGRIARIVNTLAWISFDVGPTLLEWLEREAPDTYRAVLAADAESVRRTGHGNAIAAPYHHVILPLSTRRDKITEVRWGIADFRRRFGREPEGMWLPETAVDDETLDVLAAEGITFTILAPHQVRRSPPAGRPLGYRTGGGRDIALCVYDGQLSHDVAFGPMLDDAFAWARRMLGPAVAPGTTGAPTLVSLATDGETFGHHHRFAEMALARLLEIVGRRPDAEITNFAAFLADHPPAERTELVAPSSWSCTHGVERWRSDCGCRVAPDRGWHQRWRAPLREALEWLAGELHRLFESEGRALFDDPWAVRDALGGPLGASASPVADLLAAHAPRPLSAEQAVRARELLLLEHDALALFTSCAWFFDDVGGLEPLQALRYAAHAIELSGAGADLERRFADRLAAAASNDPAVGDGRRLYRERARPSVPPTARVAASYAAARRFAGALDPSPVGSYDAGGEGGHVRVVDRRTGREAAYEASVESRDGWQFRVTVTGAGSAGTAAFGPAELTEREREAVGRGQLAAIASRALPPEARRAVCEGSAALGEAAERELPRRLAGLALDRSPAARQAVLDLLDLLDLLGRGVSFDAQTAFHRVREALGREDARELAGIALRLGFAAGA